jgi:thymidylate kinase
LNDSLFLDEPIENLVARLRNRNQSSALKRLEEEARILKSIHAKISEQLHRLQVRATQ